MKNTDKASLNVLGINSGTSADGLDFSVVRTSLSGTSAITAKLLKNGYRKFPPALRRALLDLADSQSTTLEQTMLLDEALGEFIGRQAKSFINSCKRSRISIDLIASHGQTVRHHPKKYSVAELKVNGTLQIGSPERISTQTSLPVISHFRNAHTALGGEGAPITTTAVYHLLHNHSENRLIVNIGGMSNYFWLPAKGKSVDTVAQDIGVGNALIDLAMKKLFNKDFDSNGAVAKQGKPSKRLLSLMLSNGFFETRTKQGAVSTGREVYSPESLGKIVQTGNSLELTSHDIIATLTEFTVSQIQSALIKIIKKYGRASVYITGGGVRNKYLLNRLRSAMDGNTVDSLAKLGWDPDFLESASYAVLGFMRFREIPALSPHKNVSPILGRLTLPPKSVKKS